MVYSSSVGRVDRLSAHCSSLVTIVIVLYPQHTYCSAAYILLHSATDISLIHLEMVHFRHSISIIDTINTINHHHDDCHHHGILLQL